MGSIYLAAPLSREEDRERNRQFAEKLRLLGYDVILPQEFGVIPKGNTDVGLRRLLLKKDFDAMDEAEVCIGYMDRKGGPSEGMIFEMGYMYAQGKPVALLNPHNVYKYGSILAYATERVTGEEEVLEWLDKVL